MRMPDAVLDMLPAEVRNNAIFAQATEANWVALRACFPSEEASVEALQANLAVILPYGADTPVSGFIELGMAVNRTDNIAGSFAVLREKFDGDEYAVLEAITRNPGVLGCAPEQLAKASAADINRAGSIASGFNSLFGPARRFLQSTDWWDEGAAKANAPAQPKAAFDPLGFGGAKDDDDELLLPQIEIDGEMYLYDLKGEYNGVEHLILTLESEPVGIWSTETMEFEECEFVDPDE
jgi:hypothetical protein